MHKYWGTWCPRFWAESRLQLLGEPEIDLVERNFLMGVKLVQHIGFPAETRLEWHARRQLIFIE